MKRFRFRLESIRQQRRWIEQQTAADYARAQQNEAREEERLREIRDRLNQYQALLERTKTEASTVTDMQIYLNYIKLVEHQQEEQRQILQDAARACEEACDQWQQANRDLKVLETLRERAHERYIKRCFAEEQKILDDLGNTKGQSSVGS